MLCIYWKIYKCKQFKISFTTYFATVSAFKRHKPIVAISCLGAELLNLFCMITIIHYLAVLLTCSWITYLTSNTNNYQWKTTNFICMQHWQNNSPNTTSISEFSDSFISNMYINSWFIFTDHLCDCLSVFVKTEQKFMLTISVTQKRKVSD